MQKSRNLIISANYSRGADSLPENFLRSAVAAACDADIMLISNHWSSHVEKRLSKEFPRVKLWVPLPDLPYRVLRRIALTFPRASRWLARSYRAKWLRTPQLRPAIEDRIVYLMHIACNRYLLAKRLLSMLAGQYDKILLADSRDVMFQRDPFEGFSQGLLTGVESGLIRDEPANSYWLNHLYSDSPALLEAIMPQKVLCSGITLGDTESMKSYLDLMCRELILKLPLIVHQSGMDQGVHNALIRTKQIKEVILTANGDDQIATLCTTHLEEFTLSPTGGLLAANHRLVSIVHQYDRHPGLEEKLLANLSRTTSAEI